MAGHDPAGPLNLDLWREICRLGDWEGVLHEGPALDTSWMDQWRAATRSGKPLASNEFVDELGLQTGKDLELRPVGRPSKKPVATAAEAGARAS